MGVEWGKAEGWTGYIDTYTAPVGGGARIYSSFSEIKLPDPSSCSIFVGENKCLDQGTVLLHGEEKEAGENIPFCAPIVSRSNRKGADYRFLAGGGGAKKF